MQPTARQLAALKAALFLLGLLPAADLAVGAWAGTLGANPAEAIVRGLGTWTLNFLVATLMITPLRRATGRAWLIRLRRMLGLFAFFYGVSHGLTFLWFDHLFDWTEIVKDITKRPFITVGVAGLLLMLPLAATSNAWAVKRLGGRRWQELHRTIYAIAILAVVHYWLMVKIDTARPGLYAAAVAFLLTLRAFWRDRERRRQLAGDHLAKPRGRVIDIIPRR